MHSEIQKQYYRCYSISEDRIVAYEDVFSSDNDSAIENARGLLKAGTLRMIELWRRKTTLQFSKRTTLAR
jgi:hypothetical protein